MYKLLLLILVSWAQLIGAQSFLIQQRKFPRFKVAESENKVKVSENLGKLGLTSSNVHVFLEIFKKEQVVNLYVSDGSQPFKLYKAFDFCTFSGELGPKTHEGDGQIPEGIYHIRDFNPWSSFYLSMGINYPNSIDKKRSSSLGHTSAGSNIYIHGSCASIGCVSISDQIKELYYLCVLAKNSSQKTIPVYMLPFNFSDPNNAKLMSKKHSQLWDDLKTIYLDWSKKRMIPKVELNKKGRYNLILQK